MSISIKFPFEDTTEGGVFKSTKTTQEVIRTNLIALLTLKRGQRPMNNALFSPLYDFINEPFDEIFQETLNEALNEKINTFIPEIEVQDIIFNFLEDTHVLEVTIKYTIIELGNTQDSVTVGVTTNNLT